MKQPNIVKPKPLLEKIAGIRDCATGDWSYEFEFLMTDGSRGHMVITGDHAQKASTLINQLNLKGAFLPDAKIDLDSLIKEVISARPEKIRHQAANCGWQVQKSGQIWYTVGNRVVGAPAGGVEYAAPNMIAGSAAEDIAERGTLDAWKARVAGKALYSTALTLGISAGLAAPLMRASGINNFVLHLWSFTRGGKSTTMLVGMSVSGIGDEMKLMNWNTSGTAELLQSATAFNDTLFSLNEVGAARAKKKDAYPILREFHMQFADGRDRRRHTSWEKANGGKRRSFRGICMVSAEHSIAWYAAQADDARDGGELFRAIDLRVVREGHKTVLDLAPADVDQNEFLDHLRDDLKVEHGTALRPYIEHLISLGARRLNTKVQGLINGFVKAMPAAAHDAVARQVAKHIGVLYAGAMLGIEAGVLPWTSEHVLKTHRTAFEDAFEQAKIADPLEMGLQLLRANLRDGIVERKPESKFGPEDRAGYWESVGGDKLIVVHTPQFRSWFSGDGQRRAVLEWLCKNGFLRQAEGSPQGVLTQNDLKGHGIRWPHGPPVRSFVFRDPFAGLSARTGGSVAATLEAVPATGIARAEGERPERPGARPPHGKRPKNGKRPNIAGKLTANGKALAGRAAEKATLGGKAVVGNAQATFNSATKAATLGGKTGTTKRPTVGKMAQNAVKPIVRGQKTPVSASGKTAVGTPETVAKPVLGGPRAAARRGRTSAAGKSSAASRNSALKIDKSRRRLPLPPLDIDDVTE